MIGKHARGSGPAVGDRVTLTHEASGSVLHGVVRVCHAMGLAVDVDGRMFDLDRDGWHVTQQSTEPPVGAVVVDEDGDAWQRRTAGWVMATALGDKPRAYVWLLDVMGPLELVWEPAA